jgi:hypothetical protein
VHSFRCRLIVDAAAQALGQWALSETAGCMKVPRRSNAPCADDDPETILIGTNSRVVVRSMDWPYLGLAHRIGAHLNPVRAVDEPVENTIHQRRIANLFVPLYHGLTWR